MDFEKSAQLIRKIRETELKQSREKFAEAMDISPTTAYRLESANKKVTNVEIFMKFYELTGYTVEEILLGKEKSNNKNRLRKRIDFILNVASEEELEYIYNEINGFMKFVHKDETRTLKDIKKNIKQKKEIN